jgi:ergothioneine biosynthesis protein EgtB
MRRRITPPHRASRARPRTPIGCGWTAGCARSGTTAGFAFDNEGPLHKAWIEPFELAARPVTNAEYLAFIEDDGYATAEHWLSDGWAVINTEQRRAPFYWRKTETGWMEHTLHGLEPLDPDAPVSHLDYYEASAVADWAGARLPEEREWEIAARAYDPERGRWAAPAGRLHPVAPSGEGPLLGLFGEVWEWTRSSYSAYPGFKAAAGAIGEYNGKFMCGQFVLRGGSALSAGHHVRATYRNFFPPNAQWQMTGLRLGARRLTPGRRSDFSEQCLQATRPLKGAPGRTSWMTQRTFR